MKIAVCFWGLCRSTDQTLQSIHENIFNVLNKNNIEYDIFLHTYSLYRPYTNPRSGEFGIQLKNSNWKLLNPTKSIIEHQDLIDTRRTLESYRVMGNPWNGNDYNTLDNHIRALWSLKQVTSLWSSSSNQYDAVMYLRPDVLYVDPLKPIWFQNLNDSSIKIPNFHLVQGCNDRFAIGKPDVMKLYGNRFDEAYEFSLKKKLHSEIFLAYILEKNKIKTEYISFIFWRVRANGEVHKQDKLIVHT